MLFAERCEGAFLSVALNQMDQGQSECRPKNPGAPLNLISSWPVISSIVDAYENKQVRRASTGNGVLTAVTQMLLYERLF